MKIHLDVFPAPREVETRTGVIVEFEIRHATCEFGGFFGVFHDFVERLIVFNTGDKGVAEADFFTDLNPVIFVETTHFGGGTFAGTLEVIIPDAGNGEVVIIPETVFVFGTVGGNGGVA